MSFLYGLKYKTCILAHIFYLDPISLLLGVSVTTDPIDLDVSANLIGFLFFKSHHVMGTKALGHFYLLFKSKSYPECMRVTDHFFTPKICLPDAQTRTMYKGFSQIPEIMLGRG